MWVDVTWGAGGSTADKTLEICINALKYHGLDVMMHLTCTNMEKRLSIGLSRHARRTASATSWRCEETLPRV